MSAKASYNTKHSIFPSMKDVPPEIWSTIIRYAAESGSGIYEYEMTPSEHADFLRGEEITKKQSFSANFRTRSYLSEVNKAWYALTVPFLYEYIHLENLRQMPSLCETIVRSKEVGLSSGGSICSFGWWTKRLDIHTSSSSDVSLVISQLADMITCLPNLRILTLGLTGIDHDGYMDYSRTLTLLDAVSAPQSLEAICWYYETTVLLITPSLPETWTAFLERHPGLVSIRGPDIVKIGNQGVLKSVRALLPIDPGGRESPKGKTMKLTDCHLPNLSSFQFYLSEIEDVFERPHFQIVGAHISVLHLEWLESPTYLVTALGGRTFPNLVEINLELLDWKSLTEPYLIPLIPLKFLKTLGLVIHQNEIPVEQLRLRKLVQEVFPVFSQLNITTIRFLAEMNVRSLRRHPLILEIVTRRLASQGVALQDYQCEPLLRPGSVY